MIKIQRCLFVLTLFSLFEIKASDSKISEVEALIKEIDEARDLDISESKKSKLVRRISTSSTALSSSIGSQKSPEVDAIDERRKFEDSIRAVEDEIDANKVGVNLEVLRMRGRTARRGSIVTAYHHLGGLSVEGYDSDGGDSDVKLADRLSEIGSRVSRSKKK